jgi:hypothetical protein
MFPTINTRQINGQPALRLVDGARLEALYGLNHPAGNGRGTPMSTHAPAEEGGAQIPTPSPSSSPVAARSPQLLSALLSPYRGNSNNNNSNSGSGSGTNGNGASSSSRRRTARATADVYVPMSTPDPAGLARKAVAAGATLEGVGATDDGPAAERGGGGGGGGQRQRQHILVRPPGGALVLVLTSPSQPSPPQQQPQEEKGKASLPPAKATAAASSSSSSMPAAAVEEGGERQEVLVGLEEGEAGIGTYFPTLRIEHRCCKNAGEVYANTPRPIPCVSLCSLL